MLTLDQLTEVLVQAAGESELVQPGEDILDREFADLGYDSLALLETSAQIKRRFGLEIPDTVIRDLATPRALLDYANGTAVQA